METNADRAVGRPSPWWMIIAVLCIAGSLAAVMLAVTLQRSADRPVGEGELFVREAQAVVDRLIAMPMDDDELSTTVRHLRNDLGIEALAVVGPDGVIRASTSPAMEGERLDSQLLVAAMANGTFAAQATPLRSPVSIDGVEEWHVGDVLYQVMQPIDAGRGAVLLMYDVSVLLERRARAAGIQTATIQALAVAVVLAAFCAVMLLGRSAARRRFREYEIEAGFLRPQAAQLEEHNRELDQARQQAERALSLAEEKNRIRSEFVMMINHELRTPLTSLVTGAQLLQSGELAQPTMRTILEDMVDDGRRLEDMIRQILDVARIENRGPWYELHDVPTATLVEQVGGGLPRFAAFGSDLVAGETPAVHTDPQTVSALIRSLADNAMSHGATGVEVTVAGAYTGDTMAEVGRRPDRALFITVTDDGPGIKPEFLPRAFEKFEKDSFSSGTGLGLYVAKLMIEAIEGWLAVDTGPTGTRMTVALPLVSAGHGSEVAA